ncbi:VAC14 [Bugula neritina]|uniref:Protein VAC14 homolog n=1 Tax=Bugula neritina TaxID=10212 RepID=A0A7J7JNL8_BUGNE|nr:VAC14 [Bugula neritina]
MLVYLPEILDGLFYILGEESPEVRHICVQVLKHYSAQIKAVTDRKDQGLADDDFSVDFASMTNILILHSQSEDANIQLHAIEWMKEFLMLAGRQMLAFYPGIVNCVLSTQAYIGDHRRACKECAKQVDEVLRQLITTEDDSQSCKLLDTATLVQTLMDALRLQSMHTKIAALRWFHHLFKTIPNKVFTHVNEVFPLLLSTLAHESDEVVIADLYVFAEIAASKVPADADLVSNVIPTEMKSRLLESVGTYFIYSMHCLLGTFNSERSLLDEKGLFIIRQLCMLLDADSVYRTMSELLLNSQDFKFISVMVRNLNLILLTATELFDLRATLKSVSCEDESSLFRCLYMSWCHNPVAVVSFCLLTQQYRLASQILQHFGEIDITVELLTEVDKLVQLLESPIFIYLRLQLLEPNSNHYIVKALNSILMILPQSEAFKTLQSRLQFADEPKGLVNEDWLTHFKTVQKQHTSYKRSLRATKAAKLS